MKIKAAIVILLFSFSAYATASENVDYCNSSENGQSWERVVSKHKYHSTWKSLQRLRAGLCQKVENGVLSMTEAAALFEREKAKKIRILRERKDKIRGRKRILRG